MSQFSKFFAAEVGISMTAQGLEAIRSGFRTVLSDSAGGYSLSKHIAGQLPYYYRKLDSILEDFQSQHNALELLVDLMATAPNTASFRNSHCGEVIAAHFLEERFKLRRLYSKLTMTTSEDTNAHKMDALFVETTTSPYEYVFVEAKASVLPTKSGQAVHHRHGLLKRMVESLDNYLLEEPRFEFVRIRENLESAFDLSERKAILSDLRPPGPSLRFLGVSVTNASTQCAEDDDFILTAPCTQKFDYYGLIVTDLASIASAAYAYWDEVKTAVKDKHV